MSNTTGRKWKKLAACGAAVPVCAVVAVLFSGLQLESPAARVERAVEKTRDAYAAALDGMGITGLPDLWEAQAYNGRLSLALKDTGESTGLAGGKGLGVSLVTSASLPDREIHANTTLTYNKTDLATGYLCVKDDLLEVYAPEFLGDTAYGLYTTTLGEELDAITGGQIPEAYRDAGFNLFDMWEMYGSTAGEAWDDLWERAQVERTGAVEIAVNEHTVSCDAYHVVLPAEEAGEEAEEAGEDVELDVYLSDGYVSAILWDGVVGEKDAAVALYLGGGENYVDDLSVEVTVDGEKIAWTSHGDHSAATGVFTDISVLRGEENPTIQSEMTCHPYDNGSPFNWALTVDEETALQAVGTMSFGKDSFSVQMEDLTAYVHGEKTVSAMAVYSAAPYSPLPFPAEEVTLLPSTCGENDLDTLADCVRENAGTWLRGVLAKFPDLASLCSPLEKSGVKPE